MATTTTVHAQLIRYTTGGDQIVINLKSTASDVSVDRTSNSKIPSSVSTAQGLADVLGNLAFKDTIADATTSASGLMTAGMVSKLNGIASGANAYSHPTYTSRAAGLYKITVDGTGHVSATTAVGKSDITALGIPGQDTTYRVFAKATADANGGTGLVPAPTKGQQGLYLRGDGTWGTPTNTVYSHPNSGVTAGTYKSVTVNAQGHITAGSNPTTLAGYGITDAAAKSHTHSISQITDNIPASKITGVLSLDNIPKSAVERVVPVTDDAARLKLTSADVQNGDVVKVTSTGQMYFVVDDTKLTTEAGYMVFSAGSAASVPWSGVTGKPSSMPASDVSAWAKAASKPSYSKSEVGLGNVDNTADSAKSVKYATSAGSAGSAGSATKATQDSAGQQINTTYIKSLSVSGRTITYTKGDNTTGTITTQDTNTTYGVFAKATADAAGGTGLVPAPAKGQQGLYLRGDGTWATPTNTTYSVFKGATSSAAGGTGLVPAPGTGNVSQYLRGDGSWATPPNTTYADATTSAHGLMTAAMVTKLNGIAAGANAYSHPGYTARSAGLYKITVDGTGHVSAVTAVSKADITALGIPGSDTNTDTKVTQSAVKSSDYTNWRTIIWGSSNSDTEGFTPTTVTDSVFSDPNLTYQPSTGTLRATTFKGTLAGNASSASSVAWGNVSGKPSTFTPSSHTHNYAGSGSAGGSANSAVKLDTTTAGSATQPVYFTGGKPAACSYTIGKSVPSNAVFTDTTYGVFAKATASAAGGTGLVPAPAKGQQGLYLRGDGTWATPTDTNTWRPLGTTADTACAGNDSRLSNSRPASDVYAWAKAASKPSYSWGEITGKPTTFSPSSHSHSAASASAAGFMSASDKSKLDLGEVVYVSKTAPTKQCIWIKLD